MSTASIRRPVVAGMFYPASAAECSRAVQDLFAKAPPAEPKPWFGALVPHAGWVCSGQVAADAIATLKDARPSANLIVIFGAVHTMGGIDYGAFDEHEAWQTPTGLVPVATDIQQQMLTSAKYLRIDGRLHRREHAIEVNVPLIQFAWPDARILPIEVPPSNHASDIGRETARLLATLAPDAVYLASSDLTHYGPDYGIDHAGSGAPALKWATHNDDELLSHVTAMRPHEALAHSQKQHSACGGGAIAALLGAAAERNATTARIINHTNSYEVLKNFVGRERADNFVGYAAVSLA